MENYRRIKMSDYEEELSRYIYLNLDGGQIQVKLDDEGVVVDAFDDDGECIDSTWKLYSEMGVEVKELTV